MLLKLIKYEFKHNRVNFFSIYAGIIALSFFMGQMEILSESDFLIGLLIFLYCICLVVLFVFTLASIVLSYKRSMFSKSSYLNMTLPVSTTQLMLSKLIMSVIWIILAYCVVFISFIIIFLSALDMSGVREIFDLLSEVGLKSTVFLFLLNMFLGIISAILLIYLCLTIAHTSLIRNHRKIIAIILFFLIYYSINWINKEFILSTDISFYYFQDLYYSIGNFNHVLEQLLLSSLLLTIVEGLIYFLATRYALNKKIEIE
ncbi:MAG: hypothetical protein ACK5KR_07610 [Breznakia sp.]